MLIAGETNKGLQSEGTQPVSWQLAPVVGEALWRHPTAYIRQGMYICIYGQVRIYRDLGEPIVLYMQCIFLCVASNLFGLYYIACGLITLLVCDGGGRFMRF